MKTVYCPKTCFALLLLLCCLSTTVFSQSWLDNIKTENPKLQDYQKAFNQYWKDRPVEKGQGYTLFKRWEWFWETRTLQDGSLPSPAVTWNAWLDYTNRNNRSTARTKSTSVVANWQPAGPATSTGGYRGLGRVNCIAFHPTNPNTFWVGAASGGLWKTTNGGSTWTTNTDNLPSLGISDIAIDPTNPNIMYIATGDADFGSLYTVNGTTRGDTKSIGVLKSTDGGITWNTTGLVWNVMYELLIGRLLIHPGNPQVLMAASSDGIWRTTNGGNSWSRITSTSNYHVIDMEFNPSDPNIVYAATRSNSSSYARIIRSTNGGATWNTGQQFATGLRASVAVSPANPALVEVLVADFVTSGLKGLWRSTNSGVSYSQVLDGTVSGKNYLHCSVNATGTGGQGWYDLAYAINPVNANEKYIGGINTWKTTDGGTTWALNTFGHQGTISGCGTNPGVATVHSDVHNFAFHPLDPYTLFQCNDGGLYKTVNGGLSWVELSNGLQISQIYRLSVAQSVNDNVITGLQDNGTKYYDTGSWYELIGGDGMECLIDYTNPLIQYSTYASGRLYRTTNAWSTSTVISNNIPGSPTGAWVTPFVVDPLNPQILYAGYDRVYKTTDRGNSWVAISPYLATDDLRSLAVSPSHPNHIWAATLTDLYHTNDGGSTWTVKTLPATFDKITYIAVHATNPNKVWITNGGYTTGIKVYVTNDAGASWSNYSDGLPQVPANCIAYKKNSDDELFVGTDIGVFYRKAGSPQWEPFNDGLPNVPVTELEISYSNNKLYAATYGRGLWSTSLPQQHYTFTGNGNWLTASNWTANAIAPTTIPGGVEVKINPVTGGSCIYIGDILVKAGGKLLVEPGKLFTINGSITFQDCSMYDPAFMGNYADTKEYTVNSSNGTLTAVWGPYLTKLKNWTSTGANTATALIENMYDDGWNDIIVKFDWSNPADLKVLIDPQATGKSYSGLPSFVRTTTSTSSYKENSFSFCERRITLSIDVYNSSAVEIGNYRIVLQ